MTSRLLMVVPVLAVSVLAVVASAAPASAGPGDHGRWGHGPLGAIFSPEVGLSDAQKTQVRQVFANHRQRFRDLGQQMRTAQTQIADRLYAPGAVQPADLAPLVQQVDQVRQQLQQERLAVALEIRALLTPDQLAKAADVRQRMGALRDQMQQLRGAPQH